MGDPLAAARHIRQALAPDATWIVEPCAADTVGGGLTPVGRIDDNGSALLFLPDAISQPGGYPLGGQAGEPRLGNRPPVPGSTRFRRAAEPAFSLIDEARP